MADDTIEAIVFDEIAIAEAIERMAEAIARDYAGSELLLLGVLKGALFTVADLARAIARYPHGPEVILDFIAVSSYGNSHRSSGEVRLLKDASESIEDRNVLIVEDIIDNGLTLQYLHRLLESRAPRSLRTAVLLDKPYNRLATPAVHYIGLTAPNEFIVGYGLDYQERYRTLPYLAKLKPATFGS